MRVHFLFWYYHLNRKLLGELKFFLSWIISHISCLLIWFFVYSRAPLITPFAIVHLSIIALWNDFSCVRAYSIIRYSFAVNIAATYCIYIINIRITLVSVLMCQTLYLSTIIFKSISLDWFPISSFNYLVYLGWSPLC